MKSTEVQKDSIRTAILMECVKNRFPDALYQDSLLYQRLASPETRNLVYECCLELVEDPQRRRDVGQLLNYVSCFPPSRETLQSIAMKCRNYANDRAPYGDVFQELKTIVETYLHHKPLSYMLGRTLPLGREGVPFRQRGVSRNPDYIQKCNLQPLIAQRSEKGNRIISFSSCSDEEFAATAAEKYKTRSGHWTVKYHVVGCKDYVNQLPLECTETIIEQQVRVLNSYWEGYPTNPVVLRATSFLIKLMCDAYVSKIPLQSHYSFFRSVTVCYLPIFFDMMTNTYAYVREHVYDIILTLGIHFQLVDSQGLYPGCTEALEEELIWILLCVLKKQSYNNGHNDDEIWIRAVKCVLCIIPPHKFSLIDVHTLYQFLSLPIIIAYYPYIFTLLSESFSRKLLSWNSLHHDGGKNNEEYEENEIIGLHEKEVSALGNSFIRKIIFLYRQSMTEGSRLSFFQILFTYVVMILQKPKQNEGYAFKLDSRNIKKCFVEFIKIGFHWHLHCLLFYQAHDVSHSLPTQITFDMDVKEMKEYKKETILIVECLLQLIEEDAHLPDFITNALKNTLGSKEEERSQLSSIITECIFIIPGMLKEDVHGDLYNIAWRMAFYCMRLSRQYLENRESCTILENLSKELVSFSSPKNRSEELKIRTVCPDVLASLSFLGRKHAKQAIEPFRILSSRFLLDSTAVDPQNAMRFYYRLIGFLTIQNGPLNKSLRADLSQLLLTEQLITEKSIIEGIGHPILWALYRALREEQKFSVCRARHVLVSFLDELGPLGGISEAQWWREVMADRYPPVALIGARKTLQVYGRNAYEKFDEALSFPQKNWKGGSVYALAVKVTELAQSRRE